MDNGASNKIMKLRTEIFRIEPCDFQDPIFNLTQKINNYAEETAKVINYYDELNILCQKFKEKDWRFFKKLYKVIKKEYHTALKQSRKSSKTK